MAAVRWCGQLEEVGTHKNQFFLDHSNECSFHFGDECKKMYISTEWLPLTTV